MEPGYNCNQSLRLDDVQDENKTRGSGIQHIGGSRGPCCAVSDREAIRENHLHVSPKECVVLASVFVLTIWGADAETLFDCQSS